MKSKTVVWVDTSDKVLPTYGVASKGRVIVMFASDADSYIAQGFAKEYHPVKIKQTEKI